MTNYKKLFKEALTPNYLKEEDRATRVDKMMSGEYEDEDYKDSKRYDDIRAELDEEFSSTEEKMINQIKSYKKRGSAMVNLPSKVRDFYFKNKEKIDALNEEFKVGDKVTYLGHPAVVTATKEYNGRDFVSVSYDKGTGKTKASDILATDGTVKAVKEDINDPVLIKTRAAQMKRDAMDSKRISAEKAMDLRYELGILDNEREDILMRIEDIGVEMEQTAEPEGGPIADELGGRLMTAEKELRAIDNQIIDIKDDLGYFDMNESDLDEGTCGYGEDGVIGDKPAGLDLNEDEIPSYLTKNIIFGKAVEDSVSFNDFQKRVYGILGPKYYKLTDQGALKDFYDSIRKPKMKEAFDLDIDDAHSGDAALDRTVGKMGYNESLQETLRKKLKKRLS